tara:strand:- start:29785 stop:30060 length:276 start_codon:yes stop_codon:yes gene_type:complete
VSTQRGCRLILSPGTISNKPPQGVDTARLPVDSVSRHHFQQAATRSFSRAVPGQRPHFIFNHSAQLLKWYAFQLWRRSTIRHQTAKLIAGA